MNRVILIGRLTRNPEVRTSQEGTLVARYTLAVNKADNKADFVRCVTFGKSAEFVEKYLHKGIKIAIEGRIQTGSYTDDTGRKVYTTDVIVNQHEFVESKEAAERNEDTFNQQMSADGFMNIPDGIDEELPFS